MRLLRHTAPVENGITEGVIWKQLLFFFFPILLGTFFQQLYNTADAIIVGKFVGKEALAAVGGTTGTLINLFVNLFVGVSSGTTVTIAQHFGGHNYDDVRRTVHTSILMAVVGGLCMTVLGLLVSRPLLTAMGTPADIMDHALTYLRVYFFGIVAAFLYNIGSGILRAVGDTQRPLYFLMAACLTNIFLDLILVVVFRLGVLGVALATLSSQILAAGLVIFTLMHSNQVYRLFPEELKFTPHVLRSVLKVGIPAGLQSNMYTISNMIIQSAINTFGTNTIAAWTAFGKIDGFFWMILSAYGISVTTFVGQNFGAQKYDRIRQSVRICLGLTLGTAVFCSFFLYFFCEPIFKIFTDDLLVMTEGMQMLRFLVPFYATYICIEVLSGAIRGVGDSLVPMIMTGCGVCLLRIVWVFAALPLRHEMTTVMFSYPLTWSITSLLFVIYYLRGGWLRRRIAKCGYEPESPTPKESAPVSSD
ncbi:MULTISPECIES: MATE family efflux transporter [unclassified Anaerotruncus]|uniref:MATE family efflux transporter n=1 Tax=unclassified Anaerotruncus TaxID=2641626 RepID=UPI00033B69DE|nr:MULTISPECIES: MATE family efflux transporter [unclassified Anaerotruncus]EOS63109.1 MATE efflux family protein [Anaerotruncus sp. G3(2012)]NBK18068.1 MATE family efflux transporter [Anaerotruncus sp. 1XD42-93]RKJ92403.1 MATE family efflux transporter [Anaerotruncus sp. 1XD22-93]